MLLALLLFFTVSSDILSSFIKVALECFSFSNVFATGDAGLCLSFVSCFLDAACVSPLIVSVAAIAASLLHECSEESAPLNDGKDEVELINQLLLGVTV